MKVVILKELIYKNSDRCFKIRFFTFLYLFITWNLSTSNTAGIMGMLLCDTGHMLYARGISV